MSPDGIVETLCEYTGRYPEEAMRQAIAQREAVVPLLLRKLEALCAPLSDEDDPIDIVLPVYLLAQFRESRAYRPLLTLIAGSDNKADEYLGDTVTMGLSRIIASLYDGDPEPLRQLVLNPLADEYVRTAVIEAFRILHIHKRVSREVVLECLQRAFEDREDEDNGFQWEAWGEAVAVMPLPELEAQARVLFSENRFFDHAESWEQLKAVFQNGEALLIEHNPSTRELIHDAVKETEGWECYRQQAVDLDSESGEDALPPLGEDSDWTAAPDEPVSGAPYVPPPKPLPYIAPLRVGRNDPCPCGSGRKYKKCCG